MKNALLTSLLVLALSMMAVASSISDFSGAWILILDNGITARTQTRLSITQQENKLIIKNNIKNGRSPFQREYIVDGTKRQMPKELIREINKAGNGSTVCASILYIAKLQGETLVVDEISTHMVSLPGGSITVPSHQVWSIDANRQTLTISNSTNNPLNGGELKMTQVYSKEITQ
jgi:hypothetical protein